MRIYVVFGQTGEWSDHCTWPVKAFKHLDNAKELITKATASANEFFQAVESNEVCKYDLSLQDWAKVNPYDPKFSMDYTGTSYYYTVVELEDE